MKAKPVADDALALMAHQWAEDLWTAFVDVCEDSTNKGAWGIIFPGALGSVMEAAGYDKQLFNGREKAAVIIALTQKAERHGFIVKRSGGRADKQWVVEW